MVTGPEAEASAVMPFAGAVDLSRSRHAGLGAEATACLGRGDIRGAHRLFRQILHENEHDIYALHGMGLVAREMRRLPVAVAFMEKALERDPRNPMIACNLGTIHEESGDYEAALVCYRNALKRGGKRLRASGAGSGSAAGGAGNIILNNIGSVLSKLGRRTEALVFFRRAIGNGAEFPEALVNMATMLGDLGEYRQANHYFRRALELDPDNAHAHHNFGQILLRQGIWEEGWEHAEWRMAATNRGVAWRDFPQSLWNGNAFRGARLVLFAEQGVGDEIRFAGMLPDVIARGGEIVVECDLRLVTLFQRSFPEIRVVARPYLPAEQGVEPFDICCPFGTLGRFFRRNREAFPQHTGYLRPDPGRVGAFRARLRELGPGPLVGLCWRSGLAGAYRSEYYATIADMRPLLAVEGVRFVNLQYDATPEELAQAREELGAGLVALDDVDLKNDLEAAAALTACMDMVVSPATSVSVMAGALGVETVEFRPFPVPESYFRDGRCPWFPAVRYAAKRQAEKWQKVLEKVAGEVALLAREGAGESTGAAGIQEPSRARRDAGR